MRTPVGEKTGLSLPANQWTELADGVGLAAERSGFDDALSYVDWLLKTPLSETQVQALASHLTTGETRFFGDSELYDALESVVLPRVLDARSSGERTLRVWNVGCGFGEPTYSIAMMIDRLAPKHEQWRVSVLGTDTNRSFLEKAVEGLYEPWSLRGVARSYRQRGFRREGHGYRVRADVRSRVLFEYLNPADLCYPAFMNHTANLNVIVCRQVLSCYPVKIARHVTERLASCLVAGGWLVTDADSEPLFSAKLFQRVMFGGLVLLRRMEGRTGVTKVFGAETLRFATTGGERSSRSLAEMRAQCEAPSVSGELENAAHCLVKARTLYDEGKHSEVVDLLSPVLLKHCKRHGTTPVCGEVMAVLARACAGSGESALALEWAREAVKAHPGDAHYHYLLATVHRDLGHTREARTALHRALLLEPNFVMAHVTSGLVARDDGKMGESSECLGRAGRILEGYASDAEVPESGGLCTEELRETIGSLLALAA